MTGLGAVPEGKVAVAATNRSWLREFLKRHDRAAYDAHRSEDPGFTWAEPDIHEMFTTAAARIQAIRKNGVATKLPHGDRVRVLKWWETCDPIGMNLWTAGMMSRPAKVGNNTVPRSMWEEAQNKTLTQLKAECPGGVPSDSLRSILMMEGAVPAEAQENLDVTTVQPLPMEVETLTLPFTSMPGALTDQEGGTQTTNPYDDGSAIYGQQASGGFFSRYKWYLAAVALVAVAGGGYWWWSKKKGEES